MTFPRAVPAAVLALVLALVLAGCTSGPGGAPRAESPGAPAAGSTSAPATLAPTSPTPTPVPTPTTPGPGTVPPPWLGTRVLPTTAAGYGVTRPTPEALRHRRFTLPDSVPMLPGRGFASRVEPAPAGVLARSTWAPGCPVGRGDLAWVRLTFWGFDDRRHTGELLVHRSVARDVVGVFGELYADRFPIEQMRITTRAELDAPPTGDGNDTGAFVCRPKAGQTTGFSEHAYGLALDLDPFQNPYVRGDLVLPELSSSYLDRGDVRPGMILPGGPAVRAFARIGWGWGGDWHTLKDLQHFSLRDR